MSKGGFAEVWTRPMLRSARDTIQMLGRGPRGQPLLPGKEVQMPLDTEEMRQITETWIDLCRLPEDSPERENKFWSHDRLWELVHDDPEAAWTIINIIRRERSDLLLSNLAAGPLEDLLVAHGNRFIDRIEALAGHDAQFRRLLGATWPNSIASGVWRRIKAVAGPSW